MTSVSSMYQECYMSPDQYLLKDNRLCKGMFMISGIYSEAWVNTKEMNTI